MQKKVENLNLFTLSVQSITINRLGKKKADKPPEKSLIVLDVKPWEADTDLVALWHQIRQYQQDGLVWGEVSFLLFASV